MMRFIYFLDKKGEFRWQLKAANNRIVSDSGEGYKTLAGVLRAINSLNKLFSNPVPVIEKLKK